MRSFSGRRVLRLLRESFRVVVNQEKPTALRAAASEGFSYVDSRRFSKLATVEDKISTPTKQGPRSGLDGKFVVSLGLCVQLPLHLQARGACGHVPLIHRLRSLIREQI